jgi:hypothetical protein
MTTLTERPHAGEFILNEAAGHYCREPITILSGEGVLKAGQVIGLVKGDTDTIAVGSPAFTGTGNGTLTRASPAYGAGVQEGTYTVRLIEGGTDSGQFEVRRPDGSLDGYAVVGTAYTGQVKFTIADGSTDFSGAAQFTLAVTIADPTGVGKYRSGDPTNTDGSGIARAVLLAEVDATSADAAGVAFVRGPCELNGNCLTYDAGVDDAPKKATKIAELLAVGIVVR